MISERGVREALLAAADYADVRVVGWRAIEQRLYVTIACERGMRTHAVSIDNMRQRRLYALLKREFCDWTERAKE